MSIITYTKDKIDSLIAQHRMTRGTTTDLDTLIGGTFAGMHFYNAGATGAPDGGAGVVIVGAASTNAMTVHIATSNLAGRPTYTRNSTSSGLSDWRRIDQQDTGWRTLSSWGTDGVVTGTGLPAGASPTANQAGHIKIRRINNVVYWHLQAITFTSQVTITIPSAFLPNVANNYQQITYAYTDGTLGVGRVAAALVIGDANKSLDPAYGVHISHLTAAAFPAPTEYPGTVD